MFNPEIASDRAEMGRIYDNSLIPQDDLHNHDLVDRDISIYYKGDDYFDDTDSLEEIDKHGLPGIV